MRRTGSEWGLVSVIVPCFNAVDYLADGVASLLGQTYSNIEVLLVDDFSTDETVNLAKSLAARDDRVRVVQSERKGANSARHTGVSLAAGDFVAFMDADDQWDLRAIEALAFEMVRLDVDLVCCGMLSRSESGDQSLFKYPNPSVPLNIQGGDAYAIELVPPTACAKLFKRRLFDGLFFQDVPFAQDWNVTYKALARVKKLVFLNDPFYVYIRRPGSTCSIKRRVVKKDLLDVFQSIDGIEECWSSLDRVGRLDSFFRVLNVRFSLSVLIRSYWLDDVEERHFVKGVVRRKAGLSGLQVLFGHKVQSSDRRKAVTLVVAAWVPFAYSVLREFYLKRISD